MLMFFFFLFPFFTQCLSIEPISMTVSPELDVSVFNLEFYDLLEIRVRVRFLGGIKGF